MEFIHNPNFQHPEEESQSQSEDDRLNEYQKRDNLTFIESTSFRKPDHIRKRLNDESSRFAEDHRTTVNASVMDIGNVGQGKTEGSATKVDDFKHCVDELFMKVDKVILLKFK